MNQLPVEKRCSTKNWLTVCIMEERWQPFFTYDRWIRVKVRDEYGEQGVYDLTSDMINPVKSWSEIMTDIVDNTLTDEDVRKEIRKYMKK